MKHNLYRTIAVAFGALALGLVGMSQASAEHQDAYRTSAGKYAADQVPYYYDYGSYIPHSECSGSHAPMVYPTSYPGTVNGDYWGNVQPSWAVARDNKKRRTDKRKVRRQFRRIDRNRDGVLSRFEYVRAMASKYERDRYDRITRRERRKLRKKFHRMDRNGNGVVTLREFMRAKKRAPQTTWYY